MFRQKLKIKKLKKKDNLANLSFQCSVKSIESFFYEKSKQFLEHKYCQLFYLYDKKHSVVIGYYTLSMLSVKHEKDITFEKLTRNVPGALIGQLGINKLYEGKGWGRSLIKEIVIYIKALSERIGCRCIFVDSLTTLSTINFYFKMGFAFVDGLKGKIIINQLNGNKTPSRKTVRMFLDLNRIEKKII